MLFGAKSHLNVNWGKNGSGTMKRILGATVGLIAASATAMAADLPVKAPYVAPVMAPAFSWSGCYIGGNVGGKWSQSDGSVTVAPAGVGAGGIVAFTRADASSFIVGGQVRSEERRVGEEGRS